MSLYVFEWHLKCTCTWITSLLSVIAAITLIVLEIRRQQLRSTAALYVLLIATFSVLESITNQLTCLREAVSFLHSPIWLVRVRGWADTKYAYFFERFLPGVLNLLVVNDTLNLYILICVPQKIPTLLSKKAVAAYLAAILGLNTAFAVLAIQVRHHRGDLEEGCLCSAGLPGVSMRTGWIYEIALNLMVAIMVSVFHIFCTVKIRWALLKAIKFLSEAHVNGNTELVYRKLVTFGLLICIFFSTFNFILNVVAATLRSIQEVVIDSFFDNNGSLFFNHYEIFIAVGYAVKFCTSLKPLFFSVAYIWLRKGTSTGS